MNNNVYDVANYIIERISPITTMKLQKLVYYCQSWALAWDDYPLFKEDFEAWANGPVCRELFNTHKGLYILDEVPEGLRNNMSGNSFAENEIETLEAVLDYYGDKDAHWLSDLTHTERPWKEARRGYTSGDYCSNTLDKEVMREFYGGLKVDE